MGSTKGELPLVAITDILHQTGNRTNLWVIKGANKFFQPGRGRDTIGIEKCDQGTLSGTTPPVATGIRSQISFIANDSNRQPGTGGGDGFQSIWSTIGRAIIHEDDLCVGEGLSHQGSRAGEGLFLAFVNGDHHRDQRPFVSMAIIFHRVAISSARTADITIAR